MTKKSAKKKTTPKKVGNKPSQPDSEKAGKDSSPPASAHEPVKEIKVIEETAPAEVTSPTRKSGRVQRPDGGKRTESSRNRSGSSRRGNRRGNNSHRPEVDAEELGQKSWKVFQHEIAEEGLALIDESTARQLAEKSIVVTRAFLEERERRLGKGQNSEGRAENNGGEELSPAEDADPPQEETPSRDDE